MLLRGGRPLKQSLPCPWESRRLRSRRARRARGEGSARGCYPEASGPRHGGDGPQSSPAEPRPPLPTPSGRASPPVQPFVGGEAGKPRKPLPPPCPSPATRSSSRLGSSSGYRLRGDRAVEVSGCRGGKVGLFFQEEEPRVGKDRGRGGAAWFVCFSGCERSSWAASLGQQKPGWYVEEEVDVGTGEGPLREAGHGCGGEAGDWAPACCCRVWGSGF